MQPTNRYHRQMLLPGIGESGQAKLAQAKVLLIGCGALGTVIAEQLVRAGIGHLRIVDRDVVELTNLQRQVLFDESDAKDGSPKAIAAARRLSAINSTVTIDPIVADVHSGNIEELSQEMQLIFDGTDNAETRYLINDAALKHAINWVYGAAIATEGRVMAIRPGLTPCLRCIFPDPPAAGELPTCDTAGVLAPAAAVIASLQTAIGLKLLLGAQIGSGLTAVDLWAGRFQTIDTGDRRPNCPCCSQRKFEFLDHSLEQSAIQLCGRNAVQIRPRSNSVGLPELARRLEAVGEVQLTDFLVRCRVNQENGLSMTIFADGRTIVQGTADITRARALFSRYVGI